jgi:Protein of unknown function/AsmA-like C-terminal region
MRIDPIRRDEMGCGQLHSDLSRSDRTRALVRSGARSVAPAGRRKGSRFWHVVALFAGAPLRALRHRWMRRAGICMGSLVALFMLAVVGLWALLANGPISLDFVTPWIASAVSENFGKRFQVDIGGTVLERDEHGRTAMRIRSITVRDPDGTVIASAPKAEVGFSAASLLSGQPRAQRLNLVGAELAIRVETDGQVTVSTGGDQRPLAVAAAPNGARSGQFSGQIAASLAQATVTASGNGGGDAGRSLQDSLASFLAWVDSLRALGLDGGELTEVGLKSGNLVVDDRRNGQQSRFENIHLILARPYAGALEFELGSEDPDHPWLLLATIKPGDDGARTVDLEARRVQLKDLLLAARIDGGQIDTDAALSARIRAEFAADGHPHLASGRIEIGSGSFIDTGDPRAKVTIDRAEAHLDWNASERKLTVPFEIYSGATRLTLTAQAEGPREPGGSWTLNLAGTGPTVLAPAGPDGQLLALNRVTLQSHIDQAAQRFDIERAEVAGKGVSVAMSGSFDYSTPDPRLKVRLTTRKLPLSAFKQMWPPFIMPPVRDWIIERSWGGTVEQGEIATNAPISTLRSGGPPVPDDGLSIQIHTTGVTVQAFDNLPEIREADLVSRTRGQHTTVTLARGTVQMPSDRKLAMSNGVFDVADTSVKNPPAKVRAKIDGPVAAAVELLNMDRLKDAAGVVIDPATTRGNVAATVTLGLPLGQEVKSSTLSYAIAADVTNFSADRFIMSQKVEAQTLHANASNQGYQLKGDVRIGGAPAAVELRRSPDDAEPELRLSTTLDDAARARFGLDAGGAITGPVGIKVGGRITLNGDADSRLGFEADFTQAKFDNLVHGWSKAPKTPAKATFTYVGRSKPARLEDIAFDGNGASLRGTVEFDQNGDFLTGAFPVFGLSEGDKTSLQLERAPDNLYKVTIRGDTFDGRNFVKAAMSGGPEPKQRRPSIDMEVDAKIGVVAGFKGELLRNLDLHLTRRGGIIRNLAALARFSSDGVLQAELRGKPGSQQTVYLESSDAGALFRFSDTYSKMYGGQMWIAMDPPTQEGAKKDGLIEVRDFTVRGEAALDGVAAGAPNGVGGGVQFSRMRVDFSKQPGRMTIQKGQVAGPTVGGSIEGVMDYAANELHLRGTFVPLYGLNTAFGDIPVVGLLLGGKEGLIGSMNYEVVGSPGSPVLRVNPISALTPGFTREFLKFPSNMPNDRFQPPTSRDSPSR